MNRLTDIELLARIDMCQTAIDEMESNMVAVEADYRRYLDELTDRSHPLFEDENNRYRLSYFVEKLQREINEENQKIIRKTTMLDAAKAELEARRDPMYRYRGKINRLLDFVLNFTCSSMPKNTASYRFVSVPSYSDPAGAPRVDPLQYQVNEENETHMTVTFFVSTDELRAFVTAAWQKKFRDLNFIGFYPAE